MPRHLQPSRIFFIHSTRFFALHSLCSAVQLWLDALRYVAIVALHPKQDDWMSPNDFITYATPSKAIEIFFCWLYAFCTVQCMANYNGHWRKSALWYVAHSQKLPPGNWMPPVPTSCMQPDSKMVDFASTNEHVMMLVHFFLGSKVHGAVDKKTIIIVISSIGALHCLLFVVRCTREQCKVRKCVPIWAIRLTSCMPSTMVEQYIKWPGKRSLMTSILSNNVFWWVRVENPLWGGG